MSAPISSFSGEFRFLSNFWLVPINYQGIRFPSTEHAYQAAKTLDEHARKRIAEAASASEAKRLGRRVKIRPDWEEIKIGIMYQLVSQKFSVISEDCLRNRLLLTGNRELIEGNHWGDTFWGVCNGVGLNHLGKILMKVRSEQRQ